MDEPYRYQWLRQALEGVTDPDERREIIIAWSVWHPAPQNALGAGIEDRLARIEGTIEEIYLLVDHLAVELLGRHSCGAALEMRSIGASPAVDLRLLGELFSRLTRRVDQVEKDVLRDLGDLRLLCVGDLQDHDRRIVNYINDVIRFANDIADLTNSNRSVLLHFVDDLDQLEHHVAEMCRQLGLARPFQESSDNSASVGRLAGENNSECRRPHQSPCGAVGKSSRRRD